MKKVVVILLVGLFLFAGFANAEGLKFRGYEFGTDRSVIRNDEAGSPIMDDKDGFMYEDTLIGRDVLVAYMFDSNNKLRSGYYILDIQASNPNIIVDTYLILMSDLEDKYGKPTTSDRIWASNPVFEDDLGWAVKTGELGILHNWTFDSGAQINGMVKSDGGSILSAIMYESKSVANEDVNSDDNDKL